MNVVIAHGWAHRLLKNNLIESAKADNDFVLRGDNGEPEGSGLFVDEFDWQPHSEKEMDLSGGDMELIRSMLEHLGHVFASGEPRLPVSAPPPPEPEDSMSPRG